MSIVEELKAFRQIRIKKLLVELVTKSYFDICIVTDLDALLERKTNRDCEIFKELQLYHCTNYRELTSEQKNLLIQCTLEYLGFNQSLLKEPLCKEINIVI